jgi:uncharacterized RDD family membrane protein YckC
MDYDNIEINTTQNVLVSYEPAGIFERGLAYILDRLVVTVYGLIVWIVFMSIASGADNSEDAQYVWAIVIGVILILPALFYHFFTEAFFNGQSLGKKVMNIKVIKLDGTQPSMGACFMRWILRILDFIGEPMGAFGIPLVAMISSMSSKNSQRLGDMAAGTTVIKLTPRASLHSTILYKAIPGYKLTFREVNKLSDRDIAIIKEVYQQVRSSRDYDALLKLANKVREQMGLGVINMSAEQFINTVLADYTQYEFDQ